jgi:hypothetical protein
LPPRGLAELAVAFEPLLEHRPEFLEPTLLRLDLLRRPLR